MTKKERAAEIARRLEKIYPDAYCELDHQTPFQLLVATVLSAQCTDKRVNMVTKELFKKYPTVEKLARVSQEELESLIHSTGFYRNKAKNILALSKEILRRHHGEVPQTMHELSSLSGVGRKTANVVLGNAFGINEGFVVDTHVARLARRWKLTTHTDPVKIEQDLMKLFPRSEWMRLSHQIIWHGRRRSFARNPDCKNCELADICPSCEIKLIGDKPRKTQKARK